MSDYIHRLCNYFSKLFIAEKCHQNEKKKGKAELPQSKYHTPLRPPSRINTNTYRHFDQRPRRQNSYPEDLSKTMTFSKPVPLVRSSSRISLLNLGSGDHRLERFKRSQSFKNPSLKGVKRAVNLNVFPEIAIPIPNQNTDICDKSGSRASSPDFYSTIGDPLECGDNSSIDYFKFWEKNVPLKKQSQVLNSHRLHPGFFKCNRGNSKIPACNSKIPLNQSRGGMRPNLENIKLPRRQRGPYTLTCRKFLSKEISGNDGLTNNVFKRSPDLGNWITYRTETSAKFERAFKSISKKKHTIGNLIDSALHSQWMQMAGINVDKEANMFRQFAGGRIVLTLGEYKFLIEKICSIHDLDYWDVLRKMATFRENELHHESFTEE